jgi:hypothetical protein
MDIELGTVCGDKPSRELSRLPGNDITGIGWRDSLDDDSEDSDPDTALDHELE